MHTLQYSSLASFTPVFVFYYSIYRSRHFRQLYQFKKSEPTMQADDVVSSKGDFFEIPQQTDNVGICIQNISKVGSIWYKCDDKVVS